MHSLIGISLCIHFLLFLHIAGLYRSRALSFIELTLREVAPVARSIPRPPRRPEKAPRPLDRKRLLVRPRHIFLPRPLKVEPVQRQRPDSLVERIRSESIPAVPGVDISQWVPVVRDTVDEVFDSRKSYLEMVRLRIERHKRYPDEAVSRQVEGRVTVHFRITVSGAVRDVSITKTSRHRALDEAALTAVRKAAPFPTPPSRFFRGEVALNITVVFELT